MAEMTAEQKEASDLRVGAYAVARNEWQIGREKWSQATKAAAYEALTRLWFAMRRDEQAIAGANACLRYH